MKYLLGLAGAWFGALILGTLFFLVTSDGKSFLRALRAGREYRDAMGDGVFTATLCALAGAIPGAFLGLAIGEKFDKWFVGERKVIDAGTQTRGASPSYADAERIRDLERLGALKEKGLLDNEEFISEKKKILASSYGERTNQEARIDTEVSPPVSSTEVDEALFGNGLSVAQYSIEQGADYEVICVTDSAGRKTDFSPADEALFEAAKARLVALGVPTVHVRA